MPTITKPQLNALQRLATGWRLVEQPPTTRLYPPPEHYCPPVRLSASNADELRRRGWLVTVRHVPGETVYTLSDAGQRMAALDGTVRGEVRLVSPGWLPASLRRGLRRLHVETAAQVHDLILSGVVFRNVPVQTAQQIVRYFTRPPA